MKKIHIILITLLLSCSEKGNDSVTDFFEKVDTFSLTSENVSIEYSEESQLGDVIEMIYIDSLLILYDVSLSHKMKLINLKKGTINKFGRKGRGPKELKSTMMKFSTDPSSNKLFVSDYKDYCIYSIDNLRRGDFEMTSKFNIQNDSINFLNSVVCSNYIIGSAIKKRFGAYNITNSEVILKYDFEKKQGALTGQAGFYNHPYENKVAYFQLFSEVMGILTIKNNDIQINEKVWLKNNDIEEITENNKTFIKPSKDRRNCFINASASSKYIYALYSGKPIGNSLESINESLLSNIVLVFDWQGNPVKKLILNRKIQSLAIDNEDNILYATCLVNGESEIVKFKTNV